MIICLIIPPSPFLLDERVFMPLGILKVAAALEEAGHKVEMLDLSGYSNYEEIVGHAARRTGALHFGITATTPQFPAAVRIADAIREARPEATIILGGPHATLTAAARKREKRPGRATRAHKQILDVFDRVVAGDGEAAVFEALTESGPQVIDADGRHSELFMDDAKLDASPWPARHLIDVPSYRYKIEEVPALSLIAQLGCPFPVCVLRGPPFPDAPAYPHALRQ